MGMLMRGCPTMKISFLHFHSKFHCNGYKKLHKLRSCSCVVLSFMCLDRSKMTLVWVTVVKLIAVSHGGCHVQLCMVFHVFFRQGFSRWLVLCVLPVWLPPNEHKLCSTSLLCYIFMSVYCEFSSSFSVGLVSLLYFCLCWLNFPIGWFADSAADPLHSWVQPVKSLVIIPIVRVRLKVEDTQNMWNVISVNVLYT